MVYFPAEILLESGIPTKLLEPMNLRVIRDETVSLAHSKGKCVGLDLRFSSPKQNSI